MKQPSTPKPPSPEVRAARIVRASRDLRGWIGPGQRRLEEAISREIRSAVSAARRGRKGKGK